MRLGALNDGESSGMNTDGFGIAADQLRSFFVGIEPSVLNVLEYSFGELWREDGVSCRIWAA